MNKSMKKQLISQFYRNNKFVFIMAIICTLVFSMLRLVLSWIMQQLIDIASGEPNAIPLTSLVIIIIGYLIVFVFVFMLTRFSQPKYIKQAIQQYKNYAFVKLTEKSTAAFYDESTAGYLSALTNDVVSIETDYLSQQLSVIRLVVTFVGALTMMIWYSPLMTAIALGLTVLPLVSSLLVGNQLKKAAQRVSDQNKFFTATLRECLDGFSVIKSFRAEKELRKVFSSNNELLEDEKCAKSRTTILVEMIGSIAGIIAQLGVFITCTYLALSGYGLTPGVVIVFVNLMNYMVQPVTELPRLLSNRKAALGLIEKLATSLEQNTTPPGNGCASNISSDILVRGVSFGYDDNKEILHNISIRFEAGKAYAIVGKSGSGKSSLLNLLMIPGLKYNGQILFDKTDIRNIPSETLYELISMIQQNVFIFNASIRDNVTMFQSFNQQEIESAIQRARLSNLLSERGEGYLCGENGSSLSGGEKQRISIARSLLKRSTILLADEITSALDVQTAYQVTSDILDLRGITRIMVTHSMEKSLLQRYDGIVVLKDGYIEEVGRFDDLMERKGYFYALYTVGQ